MTFLADRSTTGLVVSDRLSGSAEESTREVDFESMVDIECSVNLKRKEWKKGVRFGQGSRRDSEPMWKSQEY